MDRELKQVSWRWAKAEGKQGDECEEEMVQDHKMKRKETEAQTEVEVKEKRGDGGRWG